MGCVCRMEEKNRKREVAFQNEWSAVPHVHKNSEETSGWSIAHKGSRNHRRGCAQSGVGRDDGRMQGLAEAKCGGRRENSFGGRAGGS